MYSERKITSFRSVLSSLHRDRANLFCIIPVLSDVSHETEQTSYVLRMQDNQVDLESDPEIQFQQAPSIKCVTGSVKPTS